MRFNQKHLQLLEVKSLMTLIELIVRYLATHVHPYPGLPPVPVSSDGTKVDDLLKRAIRGQF